MTRRAVGALVAISTALGLPAAPAVASTYPTTVVAWGHNGYGQASVPAGLTLYAVKRAADTTREA